jgi:hypothetical protein
MMNQAMLAAKLQASKEDRNAKLEEALAYLQGGRTREEITLPSGLRVRMKKPPLSQLLGGNPLDPEGAGGDDELLKMLKVTRGQ